MSLYAREGETPAIAALYQNPQAYTSQMISAYKTVLEHCREDLKRGSGEAFHRRWCHTPVDALKDAKRLGLPLYKARDMFIALFQGVYSASDVKRMAELIYASVDDDPERLRVLYLLAEISRWDGGGFPNV